MLTRVEYQVHFVYILIILSGSLLVFDFDAYGIAHRNLVLIIPVILRMST